MMSTSASSEWTAVVLSGGRGSRLGNDDKAAITIGGRPVLDLLLGTLPDGVPVVVSGPARPTQRTVTFRRETPIHGGPVAAVASALEAVHTPVTALLAVDMPWAGGLVTKLVTELTSCDSAALVPVDRSGFRQPLCAVVRTDALRRALLQLGKPQGRSLRDLMSLIDVQERPLSESETQYVDDIDTPADLRRARSAEAASRVAASPTESAESDEHEPEHEQGAKPAMKTWINAVCTELDLPNDVNLDVILDVARVAAHSVERPAAPVTTFLLGLAVANGLDVEQAAAKIQQLAATWAPPAE
jgi:molybdopterin-guanine dinucleotide biosynthesis protein A